MTPDEEDELAAEHWKTMHILNMGESGKDGTCKERCGDWACDAGCLRPKAKHFRRQIMHGIKYLRDSGSDKYPLNPAPALDPNHKCDGGDLWYPGSRDKVCKDPVCRVSGCLNQPAWQFRELIKIELENELLNALKK